MVSQQNVFAFTCADPVMDRGPNPLINHKNIGFLSNTGPEPHKKNHSQGYKASVQGLAIIGPPVNKRRSFGVSGVIHTSRWWADYGPLL